MATLAGWGSLALLAAGDSLGLAFYLACGSWDCFNVPGGGDDHVSMPAKSGGVSHTVTGTKR
jgi:hypothetical protein